MNGIIYWHPIDAYNNRYVGVDELNDIRIESEFFDWCGMELYVAQQIKKGKTDNEAYEMYWQEIAEYAGVHKDDIDLDRYAGEFDNVRQEWTEVNYRVEKGE